ncbi:MAG TPA: phytanoyl-CoA dioxygenase family protein [Chthoniobacter sp.]|nr:phytanoyl-CoA dioxygenase family protein [Chthoniobacter sp.]
MPPTTTDDEIAQSGFALMPGVMDGPERQVLLAALGEVAGAGRRGLLGLPAVAVLARSERWLELARPHLPAEPRAVRAIYFDKSAEANWGVAWHQDLTIALQARVEAPGFGPWSVKEGIPHVQPPVELLERMLTIRLHLDDADETNGALRVLPGSHHFGRPNAERIQELRGERDGFLCEAAAGDALLMRPLLLHASGRSVSPRHRRVLHIEYAGFALPEPLRWHEGA